MLKFVILADDCTGALDAAVPFVKQSIPVQVFLTGFPEAEALGEKYEVVSVALETRHLPPEEAYGIVRRAAEQAWAAGAQYIYKKTDSALRGNIGAELRAVMDGTGEETLAFIPAFPQMDRTTREGIQYIGETRLEDSAYGQDPFEPARESDVSRILRRQTDTPAQKAVPGEPFPEGKGILIWDARTTEDMKKIAGQMRETVCRLFAGCGGFAEFLPQVEPCRKKALPLPPPANRLLIVAGSIHPATRRQLAALDQTRYVFFTLSQAQMLQEDFADSPEYREQIRSIKRALHRRGRVVLRSAGGFAGEELHSQRDFVCGRIGKAVEDTLRGESGCALAVFGGDTLLESAVRLVDGAVYPVGEVVPGVVAARARNKAGEEICIVSKSGGFGEEDVVERITDYIFGEEKAI